MQSTPLFWLHFFQLLYILCHTQWSGLSIRVMAGQTSSKKKKKKKALPFVRFISQGILEKGWIESEIKEGAPEEEEAFASSNITEAVAALFENRALIMCQIEALPVFKLQFGFGGIDGLKQQARRTNLTINQLTNDDLIHDRVTRLQNCLLRICTFYWSKIVLCNFFKNTIKKT